MRILKRRKPEKTSYEERKLLSVDEMINLVFAHYETLDEAGKKRMHKRIMGDAEGKYPMAPEAFDEMLEEDFLKWEKEFKDDIPNILKEIDNDDYLEWELATPLWKQKLVEIGIMKR